MPSLKSKLLYGALKSVKPLLTGVDIPKQRKGMDLLRYVYALPKSVELRKAESDGMRGEWAIPAEAVLGKVILYSHGGAYISGSPSTHEPIICRLAEQSHIPVFAYPYRLAPENPFPAALEDAKAAVAYLQSQGYALPDMVFCGDSAGGGLTLALTMALRDAGSALPAALVVISPWTDLAMSRRSHRLNEPLDPLLSLDELRRAARLYAGDTPVRDPYISPLYGDFTGFPPTLIHVGSEGMLLDDAKELATAMDAQGVCADIDIYEGMFHVWHQYDLPEAHAAMEKITSFMYMTLEIGGEKRREIRIGGRYRHFKGRDYRVLHVARDSETLEELVVYQQLYGEGGIWVRPQAMFLEYIERGGRRIPRFAEVDEEEGQTQ